MGRPVDNPNVMETGRALEIVHGMAERLYKHYGVMDPARTPSEVQMALDTVHDFIVNNFDTVEYAAPDPIHEENGQWYFWDETWANRLGPYPDRATAAGKLDAYIKQLQAGD
jgi:hypothetical protein